MGNAIIKIKIMPTSLEASLKEIKTKAQEIIAKNKGEFKKGEEQPIAFGLKALILTFTIPESQELEPIEIGLEKIENVSSSQLIDMRREVR